MNQAILEAKHLRKSFNKSQGVIVALDNVSLNIMHGEVLAFLGPNGAGKTTAIRIITGLLEPDSGEVFVDGINTKNNFSILGSIGTVLEGNRNLYWRLTPLENLEYFAVLKGMRQQAAKLRSRVLLERFGLSAKGLVPVQALSRGMQQKVAIAVALVHSPKLLLLDEPTLGLDVEASQDVIRLVREIAEDGCGVLLTTHQLDVAETLSHRTAIIRDGKILVEEPTKDIIRRFSGDSYTITVDAELLPEHIQAIEKAGGLVFENHIVFRGLPEGIYAVLSALAPIPIIKVEKTNANLTDVFLQLTRNTTQMENSNANVISGRV